METYLIVHAIFCTASCLIIQLTSAGKLIIEHFETIIRNHYSDKGLCPETYEAVIKVTWKIALTLTLLVFAPVVFLCLVVIWFELVKQEYKIRGNPEAVRTVIKALDNYKVAVKTDPFNKRLLRAQLKAIIKKEFNMPDENMDHFIDKQTESLKRGPHE